MNADWQSIVAPLVVLAAIVGFVIRAQRNKKHGGGCASCGGGKAKPSLKKTLP